MAPIHAMCSKEKKLVDHLTRFVCHTRFVSSKKDNFFSISKRSWEATRDNREGIFYKIGMLHFCSGLKLEELKCFSKFKDETELGVYTAQILSASGVTKDI